ncbi:nucleolar protein 9 [Aspergillus unguis]
MPRENQKRGRRATEKAKKEESKRKRDEAPEESATKRLKPSADENDNANDITAGADYIPLGGDEGGAEGEAQDVDMTRDEMPFYGLLDSEEQEYFSRANEMLELNQFEDAEERRLFVDSVFREARGKELKIACSQSCSRLMEKLISVSDITQIRRLFNKFIGHFLTLVQHRFASHCCERLFISAAPGVTQKVSKSKASQAEGDEEDEPEPEMSLAEMFMQVVEELQGNWGYLLTERFASHTIRVLLLVLAGEPVDVSSNDSVVASKKKERLGVVGGEAQEANPIGEKRSVPEAFETTLKKVMQDMVSVLDDTYLRALATHPVGNPVLQVLVRLELSHFGKSSAKQSTSITKRLIPDENFEEDSETTRFIRGLLYDPVGSRLLETMVRHMPGKLFKSLYKNFLREQMSSLARNQTAGYVVLRVLERLGKDDLQAVVEQIAPKIPGLIERSRTIVPKVLIERCLARGVDTKPLAKALEASYDSDPTRRLEQMLKLETATADNEKSDSKDGPNAESNPASTAAERLHGSLLAQTIVTAPGQLSQLVFSSLLALSPEALLSICKDPTASRVVQQALTSPASTPQFRRQFTTRFTGHMSELALDSSGSHVVDSLWSATKDIYFVKERFAQELTQDELALRDSFVGRAVWRNWAMDLYKRRRGEWAAKAKGKDMGSNTGASGEKPKSRIEMARARYAAQQAPSTSANAVTAKE